MILAWAALVKPPRAGVSLEVVVGDAKAAGLGRFSRTCALGSQLRPCSIVS
jgi:hypothetical protein